MNALPLFATFLFSLLFLFVGYLAARIVLAVTILSNRQSHVLAGSSVPPLFARPCSAKTVSPSVAVQGRAAFLGARS